MGAAGRRGVVLRLGVLDGPGTGHDHPNPSLGATLHTEDAGRALLAALSVPSGIYNVPQCSKEMPSSPRLRRVAMVTGKTGWGHSVVTTVSLAQLLPDLSGLRPGRAARVVSQLVINGEHMLVIIPGPISRAIGKSFRKLSRGQS
jgi:hypothetical protein